MLRNDYNPGEEVEHLITDVVNQSIETSLSKGFNVIVDETHCNLKRLKAVIERYAPKARIVLEFVGLNLSLVEIKRQNLQRDKVVPEAVIDKMNKGLKEVLNAKSDLLTMITELSIPVNNVTLNQDVSLPKAIIVDLDGTVAHMDDKRGPFDWLKVDNDRPDEHVLNIVRTLSSKYKVLFVTGRDASALPKTKEWLDAYYGQPYEAIWSRPSNDFRKDSLIKEEIFNNHIKGVYYVEVVFDDRVQVVKQWRSMGLKCLQVQEGDF